MHLNAKADDAAVSAYADATMLYLLDLRLHSYPQSAFDDPNCINTA